MHAGTLRALEFDRIVRIVGGYAQTPMGAARLADVAPLADTAAVSRALETTDEAVAFLADHHVGLQAPAEFEDVLDGLTVEGRPLEPLQLLALAAFLASVDATSSAIRRARTTFPRLRVIADAVASFERESADVRRKIDPA